MEWNGGSIKLPIFGELEKDLGLWPLGFSILHRHRQDVESFLFPDRVLCSVFSPGYGDILRQINFLSWFQASSLSVLIAVDRHGRPILLQFVESCRGIW